MNADLCYLCNCRLDDENRTRDHVEPLYFEGKHTEWCCERCNKQKANLTLLQYLMCRTEHGNLGHQARKIIAQNKRDKKTKGKRRR